MTIRFLRLTALCCSASAFFYSTQNRVSASSDVVTHLFQRIHASHSDSRLTVKEKLNFEDPPFVSSNVRIGLINLKTGRVDAKLKDFPYFTSTARDRQLSQLIPQKKGLVAFCEGAPLKRMNNLIKTLPKSIGCLAYCTGKKGENFHPSLKEVNRMCDEGKDPYIGDFVGIFYNQTRFRLLEKNCLELPEGRRHSRIAVLGVFFDKESQGTIALYAFHLDHLDPQQRDKSIKFIREHTKQFHQKNHLVVLAGDSNFFPDQGGLSQFQALTAAPFYDPRKVAEKHYGPIGTIKGGPAWKSDFVPPIKRAPSGHYYRDGASVDIIVAKEQTKDSTLFFVPTSTEVLPGYINEESGILYKLSEKIDRMVLEKWYAISDHHFITTTFETVAHSPNHP